MKTQSCFKIICVFENKRVEGNSLPVIDKGSQIDFVQEGQKGGHLARTNSAGKFGLEIVG